MRPTARASISHAPMRAARQSGGSVSWADSRGRSLTAPERRHHLPTVAASRIRSADPDGSGSAIAVSALDGSGAQTLVAQHSNRLRAAACPLGLPMVVGWRTVRARCLVQSTFSSSTPRPGHQRRVAQLPPIGNVVGQPAWLPDNRHLVISYLPFPRLQAPADLGIIDIQDGSITRLTTTVGNAFLTPACRPTARAVIATGLAISGEVWKVPLGADPDANRRSAVRLVDGSALPMWTFVSRDGRTLLFNSPASGSRNLWTMPTDGSASPRQITAQPNDSISHSSLSPDGTHVAFASIASGHSDIWTQNIDGSDLRQLTNDEAADSWPMWSPDGSSIAYVSFRNERAETWRIPSAGGTPEKILDQFVRGDWIRQPGGTGTWIATGGVQLIDVERRSVVWNRMTPNGNDSTPTFSGDGKFISAAFREGGDRVIRVFDTATGESRVAARLSFRTLFHVSWTDSDRAFIVNRFEPVSHIVLFDRFWSAER